MALGCADCWLEGWLLLSASLWRSATLLKLVTKLGKRDRKRYKVMDRIAPLQHSIHSSAATSHREELFKCICCHQKTSKISIEIKNPEDEEIK